MQKPVPFASAITGSLTADGGRVSGVERLVCTDRELTSCVTKQKSPRKDFCFSFLWIPCYDGYYYLLLHNDQATSSYHNLRNWFFGLSRYHKMFGYNVFFFQFRFYAQPVLDWQNGENIKTWRFIDSPTEQYTFTRKNNNTMATQVIKNEKE